MTDHARSHGFWFANAQVKVHLAGAANADKLSLLEHRMAEGFSPPLHVHHHEAETFYVLDGRFRFVADGAETWLESGGVIHIPAGVAHSFQVVSPGGGRCLTMTSGGFEQAVRDASRPASADTLPDQSMPRPEQQRILSAACARNGIDLIGPPLE